MGEESFKDRLIKESDELLERLKKLHDFLGSEKVLDIDPLQHRLLSIQMNAMQTYSNVLQLRIEKL